MNSPTAHPFIKWFADITIADVSLVGGKNASLGEMVRELASKGVKVPDGFAITAEAFRHFIRKAGTDARIRATLADLDTHDMANLSERGQAVRQAILNATLPPDLQGLICEAYRQLQGQRMNPAPIKIDLIMKDLMVELNTPEGCVFSAAASSIDLHTQEGMIHITSCDESHLSMTRGTQITFQTAEGPLCIRAGKCRRRFEGALFHRPRRANSARRNVGNGRWN